MCAGPEYGLLLVLLEKPPTQPELESFCVMEMLRTGLTLVLVGVKPIWLFRVLAWLLERVWALLDVPPVADDDPSLFASPACALPMGTHFIRLGKDSRSLTGQKKKTLNADPRLIYQAHQFVRVAQAAAAIGLAQAGQSGTNEVSPIRW